MTRLFFYPSIYCCLVTNELIWYDRFVIHITFCHVLPLDTNLMRSNWQLTDHNQEPTNPPKMKY